MAGADKLIEKIESDAQRDSEKSWQDVQDKKDQLRTALLRDIEKQKAQIERMAQIERAEKKKRMAAVYDLEYRKQLLQVKQEMMAKAKALAKEKLLKLDDISYIALMKKQLIDCAPSGTGTIAVASTEKRLNGAFLADVNARLKEKSGKGEVKLSDKPLPIAGGFVYTNDGLEINVSLDAQLNEAWRDIEMQVAAALFED